MSDLNNIKRKFPLLSKRINKHNIVYLDTASSSQKPVEVINFLHNYYVNQNSNTGRAPYSLSEQATEEIAKTREKVKNFINSQYSEEIIFTKGTTESLNIIAMCYGMHNINENDEIVLAISEHHSNLIPWQQVAKCKKAKLKYIYFDADFKLSDTDIENVITDKTKIISVAHISNTFGIINPIKKIIKKAKQHNSIVVIDAAQSISHLPTDVTKLDVDFLAFSGHKMYAPMGTGVLYGKKELLDSMHPYIYGGGMIDYVTENTSTFAPLPEKFEGGTKNVGSIIGLGIAIDFINSIGFDKIIAHEKNLYKYAYKKLKNLGFVKLYVGSNLSNHSGVLSFEVNDVHSHDVASILDSKGICIRPGKHCTHPLLEYLNINSTCRISFGIYNDTNDIDKLIDCLKYVKELFNNGPE